MHSNLDIATDLSQTGRLRIAIDPGALPPPSSLKTNWDRIEGMLLGLAIGDALGNTSESLLPAERRRRFREIRDYLPNRGAGGRAAGLPSDDTQLAFRTLEHLLDWGMLDPARLGDRLADGPIYGMGRTVESWLRARGHAAAWIDASRESAGNGALMRIAPVLLPHLASPGPVLWADAALAGAVTHNDFASNASCVAFVAVLWEALAATAPVEQGFWLDQFVDIAGRLEGDEKRYAQRKAGACREAFTLAAFTSRSVWDALDDELSTLEACDHWYSGAYLLETVPSVLHILERHANDPEEAMVRAVNDTFDNDTVAAIVGAAVGALHGARALPRRWRDGLLGRLGADDDGMVFQLLARARATFWNGD